MGEFLASATVGISGLILVTAGVSKSVNREGFRLSLADNSLLSSAAPFIVRVIPPIEIVVGALLLISSDPILLVLMSGTLYLAFALTAMTSGPGECNCGPFVPKRRGSRLVLTVLIAVSSFLVVAFDAQSSVESRWLLGSAAILFAVVVMALRSMGTAGWWRRHSAKKVQTTARVKISDEGRAA